MLLVSDYTFAYLKLDFRSWLDSEGEEGGPRETDATALLPSDLREVLEDMVLPVRLFMWLSLSTMSVIAVFALWAAARRGREVIFEEVCQSLRFED